MNSPASRRLLLGLLVAAWLIVDVALAAAFRRISGSNPSMDTIAGVVLLGCYFGQIATLVGWLALGDGSWLVRTPLVALGLVLLAGLALFHPDQMRIARWLQLSLVYMGLVFIPLLSLRLFGVHCGERGDGLSANVRLQFSIYQVLSLTTLVAVALAILRQAKLDLALIELALCGIAWVTWLALFRLPVLAAAPTVAGAAVLFGWLAGVAEGLDRGPWIAFSLIQAIVLAANLAVLRVAGYELRWRRPTKTTVSSKAVVV